MSRAWLNREIGIRWGLFLGLMILGSMVGASEAFKAAALTPLCRTQTLISAWILQALGSPVVRIDNQLHDPVSGQAIEVLWACSGADVCFILAAAMGICPASIKARLIGIVLGFLMIQGMNVVRIISLFYLNIYSPAGFEFAHLYLWQGLLMLDALVLMLVWLRWASS